MGGRTQHLMHAKGRKAKEKEGPERGGGERQHHLRVHQERQPGARLDHVSYVNLLRVSHVAQDGEDHDGREEGGEGINAADEDGVLVAVMVELVVAPEGEEGPDANSVGEKDLSAAV